MALISGSGGMPWENLAGWFWFLSRKGFRFICIFLYPKLIFHGAIVIGRYQAIDLFFVRVVMGDGWYLAEKVFFVRDGILSVADYNSTRVGVVVVVVVVVNTFLRWDNLRTLWAIKLKFCMVTSHDIVLWIRIRELILHTQTGPTSQPAKNFKMG